MKQTFNGCSRSNFSVSPANWKTSKASIKKPWRIFYRFYYPAFNDHAIGGKTTCGLRGMNDQKTMADRQIFTQQILNRLSQELDVKAFNPTTASYISIEPDSVAGEIRASPPLLEALTVALSLVDAVE